MINKMNKTLNKMSQKMKKKKQKHESDYKKIVLSLEMYNLLRMCRLVTMFDVIRYAPVGNSNWQVRIKVCICFAL